MKYILYFLLLLPFSAVTTKGEEHGYGDIEIPIEERFDQAAEDYFNMIEQSKRTGRRNGRRNGALDAIPDSYSSVELGYVSPVRDQRTCGSCAAFATVALIEVCFKKLTGVFGDYSEQQLLDCGFGKNHADGCDGADMQSYLKTIRDEQLDLTHESYFPYQGNVTTCPANLPLYNQGARVKNFYPYFGKNGEEKMKEYVFKHGAVIARMATGKTGGLHDLDHTTGILKDCGELDGSGHAFIVVGYGTENGVDYWLAKNSWGENHGENGYFRIQRGVEKCGIGKYFVVAECERVEGPTDAPLTTKEPCFDKAPTKYCNKKTHACWRDNIKANCKETCGLCEGMKPLPSVTCYDIYNNCPDLAKKNQCGYFKNYCDKSCGLCGN